MGGYACKLNLTRGPSAVIRCFECYFETSELIDATKVLSYDYKRRDDIKDCELREELIDAGTKPSQPPHEFS